MPKLVKKYERLRLKDAGVVLIDCDHRTPPASENGYPYIAIPQLKDGRIDPSSARKISQQHFIEWTRKAKPTQWDVVLSRRCNPGVTAHVPANFDFALGQNLVLLRSDGSAVRPEFLRWLVSSPNWWEQIAKYLNVGAVFDSLRCADIPNFELPIPPLEKQQRIANILSSLDDKIELNRKMNVTLEKIAQAIYRHWFVDFEFPNTNGKPYRSGGGKMKVTTLGEIPDGWEIKTLDDVTNVKGGTTPSTTQPVFWTNGSHHFVTPKDLSKLEVPAIIDTDKKITDAGLNEIGSGLLPIGTLLLSSRAPIGYMAITQIPVAINQGFIGILCDKGVPISFMLMWTKLNLDRIISYANGTTFLEISKSSFRQIEAAIPPPDLLERYGKLFEPLFGQIVTNHRESTLLASTRDRLLPKLISGEIAV